MLRQEKEAFVSHVKGDLLNSQIVIVVNRTPGITVEEITKLRKRMVASKSKFKVIKNTLAKKAFEGSVMEGLNQYLSGNTGLAYSDDPIEAAKAVFEFCKENENKMEIVSGFMDGSVISGAQIKELATLPSLEGIRAQILGLLSAVAGKLVRTINEPASQLARVFAARAKEN